MQYVWMALGPLITILSLGVPIIKMLHPLELTTCFQYLDIRFVDLFFCWFEYCRSFFPPVGAFFFPRMFVDSKFFLLILC